MRAFPPRMFLRVGGGVLVVLGLVAALPIAPSVPLVHGVALGVAHLVVGSVLVSASWSRQARAFAQAAGIAFLFLAVLGMISAGLLGLGRVLDLRLAPFDNVLHLVLGAWGARAALD